MDGLHRSDALVWWVLVDVYAVGRNRMNGIEGFILGVLIGVAIMLIVIGVSE